jgi:hypothetical protein
MKFDIEDRGNGITWIRVYDYRSHVKVADWCETTGCGKRVNHTAFSFKREQDLTAFLLRWQGQE